MNNKKLLIIFLIITISFSLKGCSSVSLNNEIKADNLLKIHYIDVGQGDSILISINGKNMLIDSGSAVKEEYIVKYLKKQGIKKLHHVIATHPHEDHIGSMSSIISNFNVENFYAPKITSSTNYFNNMIDELMKKVDSKYTLVVVSAKRARTLTENQTDQEELKTANPVSIALKEIVDDNVSWERTKSGIK
jgi:competence protein ComEC